MAYIFVKKSLYLLFENFKHVYNVVWLCPPPFFYNPSLTPHQISLPTSGPLLKIIVTESNWCIGASHMCTYAEHRWPSRNHNSWSKLTLSERSSTAICSSARGGASWAPPPSWLEFLLAWSFPDPRLRARCAVDWWVWWPCHVQNSLFGSNPPGTSGSYSPFTPSLAMFPSLGERGCDADVHLGQCSRPSVILCALASYESP